MPASFTAINNNRLQSGDPADEELFSDLADNDHYQQTDATNGGSGIAPTVDAFTAAFTSHLHTGADGQGQTIPTAGIANSGVNASDMFPAGIIDTNELANSGSDRMQAVNFADGAITPAKLHPDIGATFTGSKAVIDGLTESIAHGLGHRPVVGNNMTGEIEIHSTSATTIVIGRHPDVSTDPWAWDFRAF